MYQHLILTYSDYSIGKRIALHKHYDSVKEVQSFIAFFQELKHQFKHIIFGFHHFETKDKTWESVVQYDRFFSDIQPVLSVEEFKDLILEDTAINPIDIAKLISSKYECTQLQLQKLLYFFWCQYSKMYGTYVFKEDFEAWTYGPVIPEVYEEFKKFKKAKITFQDKKSLDLEVYSRMVKISNYDKIVEALDKTIEKYGKCTSTRLVSKSHEKGGPWDLVFKNGIGSGEIIPKQLIMEYAKANG